MWKILIGLVVVFVAIVTIANIAAPKPGSVDHDRMIAREAVGLCWEDQKRKSLPPNQTQFIAGACESMEAKFKTTYGYAP